MVQKMNQLHVLNESRSASMLAIFQLLAIQYIFSFSNHILSFWCCFTLDASQLKIH